MYKVLLINCSQTSDVKAYFKKKGLDIQFKTLLLKEEKLPYIHASDAIGEDGKKVPIYTPVVADLIKDLIQPNEYNAVIYAYNPKLYGSEFKNTGGNTLGWPMYLGTQFCTIRDDSNDELYMKHEMMHMMCNHLTMLGYPVMDQMDKVFFNEEWHYYYKNTEPNAPDGNFARTWATIAPYIQYLDDTCPILKKGMKSGWVAELQRWLRVNGYIIIATDGKFGPYTEACVKDFQKRKGLMIDGCVGPITIKELYKTVI